MHKHVSTLLQREMTRKEFLATLGVGAASVMGFGGLVRLLAERPLSNNYHKVSSGYGSSPYGGSKASAS